jgi:hypothetical protein
VDVHPGRARGIIRQLLARKLDAQSTRSSGTGKPVVDLERVHLQGAAGGSPLRRVAADACPESEPSSGGGLFPVRNFVALAMPLSMTGPSALGRFLNSIPLMEFRGELIYFAAPALAMIGAVALFRHSVAAKSSNE